MTGSTRTYNAGDTVDIRFTVEEQNGQPVIRYAGRPYFLPGHEDYNDRCFIRSNMIVGHESPLRVGDKVSLVDHQMSGTIRAEVGPNVFMVEYEYVDYKWYRKRADQLQRIL